MKEIMSLLIAWHACLFPDCKLDYPFLTACPFILFLLIHSILHSCHLAIFLNLFLFPPVKQDPRLSKENFPRQDHSHRIIPYFHPHLLYGSVLYQVYSTKINWKLFWFMHSLTHYLLLFFLPSKKTDCHPIDLWSIAFSEHFNHHVLLPFNLRL